MRVTLKDIAKRVGVSHSTVSFTLSGRMDVSIPAATRERVLAVAQELGYRPNRSAQALVRGRTNVVTLWRPAWDSPLYSNAQRCFDRFAAADGFVLVTRLADGEVLDDQPSDGQLLLDCGSFEAVSDGVSVVSIGSAVDLARDHVAIDLASGVREMMAHLASADCRRIAFLTSSASLTEEPGLAAYLSESKSRKIEPRVIEAGSTSRIEAREAVKALIGSSPAPEAILARNDALATGACRGLEDSGFRVPDDVLVSSCEGSEEGECATPSITSLVVPESELFERAWRMLRTHMEPDVEEPTRGSEVLKPSLVVRESSTRTPR